MQILSVYSNCNKSVFSFLHQLTTWHCSQFLLSTSRAAVDQYLLYVGPTAANLPHTAAVINRWDRQTDRQISTVLLHRPCSILCKQCQQLPCMSFYLHPWAEGQRHIGLTDEDRWHSCLSLPQVLHMPLSPTSYRRSQQCLFTHNARPRERFFVSEWAEKWMALSVKLDKDNKSNVI